MHKKKELSVMSEKVKNNPNKKKNKRAHLIYKVFSLKCRKNINQKIDSFGRSAPSWLRKL